LNTLDDVCVEKVKTGVDLVTDEFFGLFDEFVDLAVFFVNDDTVFGGLFDLSKLWEKWLKGKKIKSKITRIVPSLPWFLWNSIIF